MNKSFLKTIYFNKLPKDDFRNQIEIFRNISELNFDKNIIFFVGENGSGKSTLLENIAVMAGFNPEWWSKNASFKTTDTDKNFANWLKLSWQPTSFDFGYFLRAESVYSLINYFEKLWDWDFTSKKSPFDFYGGKNLHEFSHWQQFLKILEACSESPGIYILDEIESAISSANQLRVKFLIEKMASNGSQFIIATHSPIILSVPNSQIFSFDYGKIMETEYNFVPCVDIYKRFFLGKI